MDKCKHCGQAIRRSKSIDWLALDQFLAWLCLINPNGDVHEPEGPTWTEILAAQEMSRDEAETQRSLRETWYGN